MSRLLLILAVVTPTVLGCRSQTPGQDPFFGRTTVPPPPTGAASARVVDPYYAAPRLGQTGAPVPPGYVDTTIPPPPTVTLPASPSWRTASATSSQSGGPGSPGGSGGSFFGSVPSAPAQTIGAPSASAVASSSPSVIRIAEPSGGMTGRGARGDPFPTAVAGSSPRAPEAGASATLSPSSSLADASSLQPAGTRVIEPLGSTPRPSFASGFSPSGVSGAPGVETPIRAVPIDIMDLPPAGASAPSASLTQPAGYRLVSGAPGDGAESVAGVVPAAGEVAASSGARGGYGYDPEYRWLRGRLEYSQIDRRWKLRYIPIDGRTDSHGGSVFLPESALPPGCERGDFVEARGRLGQADSQGGFAPEYVATEVIPLGRAAR